jgi:hypothetical protein
MTVIAEMYQSSSVGNVFKTSLARGLLATGSSPGPSEMIYSPFNLFSRAFLDRRNAYELLVEQKVVENLQRTGNEERSTDQRRLRE